MSHPAKKESRYDNKDISSIVTKDGVTKLDKCLAILDGGLLPDVLPGLDWSRAIRRPDLTIVPCEERFAEVLQALLFQLIASVNCEKHNYSHCHIAIAIATIRKWQSFYARVDVSNLSPSEKLHKEKINQIEKFIGDTVCSQWGALVVVKTGAENVSRIQAILWHFYGIQDECKLARTDLRVENAAKRCPHVCLVHMQSPIIGKKSKNAKQSPKLSTKRKVSSVRKESVAKRGKNNIAEMPVDRTAIVAEDNGTNNADGEMSVFSESMPAVCNSNGVAASTGAVGGSSMSGEI
jgi:hypothetical protein